MNLVIGAARNDPDIRVRGEALRFLAAMPGDQPITTIEEMARAPGNEQLQSAAIAALGRSDNPRARQSLRAIVERNDVSENLRIAALSSIDTEHSPDNGAYIRAAYPRFESPALKAAAMGLPYLPTLTGIGGDIVKAHPGIRPVDDPFGGPSLLAVAAVRPDVAVVHVQRADDEGNAHLWGNLGLTVEATYAARRTVVICEEIVPREVIRSDPNRTLIPGFLVSAVVEEPGGALPASVQGYWRRDFAPFLDYHQISRTAAGLEAWLQEWVHEVPDRAASLRKLGEPTLARLRVLEERLAAPANFAP